MTGHIPYVGKIIKMLKQPVVVILILACIFFLTEGSFKKESEEETEELEKIKAEIRRLQGEILKNNKDKGE